MQWPGIGGFFVGDAGRLLQPTAVELDAGDPFRFRNGPGGRRNRAKGIKAFKVKVGLEPEKDIQVIKALRENLGPRFCYMSMPTCSMMSLRDPHH